MPDPQLSVVSSQTIPMPALSVAGSETIDLRQQARDAAVAAGLDPDLVHRLITRESNYNPSAISSKGAIGLMQLMPGTAAELGVDPDDPTDNIKGGVSYLKSLMDRYQGDTRKAVAAYNAGPGAVDQYGDVPPFKETQEYVTAIVGSQPTVTATPTAPARHPVMQAEVVAQTPATITGGVRPAVQQAELVAQSPPTITGHAVQPLVPQAKGFTHSVRVTEPPTPIALPVPTPTPPEAPIFTPTGRDVFLPTVHPFDAGLAATINQMAAQGKEVRVISRDRTAEQQAKLFAQGRGTPGPIVTEKSGQPGDESLHQLGRAADLAFFKNGKQVKGSEADYQLLGQTAKANGLQWGGDWQTLKDYGHVQGDAASRRPPVRQAEVVAQSPATVTGGGLQPGERINPKTGQIVRDVPMGQGILDPLNPVPGVKQAAKGAAGLAKAAVAQLAHPAVLPAEPHVVQGQGLNEQTMKDANDLINGVFVAARPLMAGAFVAQPIPVTLGLVRAYLAQKIGEAGAAQVTDSPEAQQLAGNLAALLSGSATARDVVERSAAAVIDKAKETGRVLSVTAKLSGSGFGTGDVPGARLAPYAESQGGAPRLGMQAETAVPATTQEAARPSTAPIERFESAPPELAARGVAGPGQEPPSTEPTAKTAIAETKPAIAEMPPLTVVETETIPAPEVTSRPDNPFRAKAIAARARADQLNKPTAHEAGMAQAFPLGPGYGRPGGEKRVERSVDRAVKAVEATKEAQYLEIQADAFDAGKINAQGRRRTAAGDIRSDKRADLKGHQTDRIEAAKAELGDKPKWAVPAVVYADSTGNLGGGARKLMLSDHREAVEQAVTAGLPVPENVLADYPDLAKMEAARDVQNPPGTARGIVPPAEVGTQPPGVDQPSAPSDADRRADLRRRARERQREYDEAVANAPQEVIDRIIAKAKAQGFTGDEATLRRELADRLQHIVEFDAEFEDSGHNPKALLQAIAGYGGLSIKNETALKGELRWLAQHGEGMQRGAAFGRIGGVNGVFNNAGLTADQMLRELRQEPRFEHLETLNDLQAAIREAATSKPEGLAADRLEKGLGERWWEALPAHEAQQFEAELAALPETEGDISFNPDELEQPVDVPTTYWKGDKAEYTGKTQELHGGTFYELRLLEGHRKGEIVVTQKAPEQQPRLPEAGAVREQNIKTPQFEAPFSLTGEVAETKAVEPSLFGPATPPTSSRTAQFKPGERVMYRGQLGTVDVPHDTTHVRLMLDADNDGSIVHTVDPSEVQPATAKAEGFESGGRTSSNISITEKSDERGAYHVVKVRNRDGAIETTAMVRDPQTVERIRQIATDDPERAAIEVNRVMAAAESVRHPKPAAPTGPATVKTYADDKRAKPYEVLIADYLEHRLQSEIARYERGIKAEQDELAKLGPKATKAIAKAQITIGGWQHVVDRLKQGVGINEAPWTRDYVATVKDAISKGLSVPREVVAQYPEFTKAVDARARYEKGRHTSFANKSVAVEARTFAEYGVKVKRQDGTPITEAQVNEITAGIREIETAIGPLGNILRALDPTIAHTNGKFPFMRGDAGGLYSPGERTVTVGIADMLGRPIHALAHEVGHLLDISAGAAIGVAKRVRRGESSVESSSLAEVDSQTTKLIREATKRINHVSEVTRLVKAKMEDQETPEEKADVQRARVELGSYWREPREVFARLFEQYVADEHGKGTEAAERPASYQKRPGWWTAEDFAFLKPMVKAAIDERLDILREKFGVEREQAPAPVRGTRVTEAPKKKGGITLQSTILPGAAEFGEYVLEPAVQKIAEAVTNEQHLILGVLAPARVGVAPIAAGKIRAHTAANDQRKARVDRHLAAIKKKMDGWSQMQTLQFNDVMEGEQPLSVLSKDWQPVAQMFRKVLDEWRAILIKHDLLDSYLQHYWPHEWKKESLEGKTLRKLFGRRPMQGPESFRKKRTIQTFRDGVAFGLTPMSWNPAEQLQRKIFEMSQSVKGRDLHADMVRSGVYAYVSATSQKPQTIQHWQRVPEYALGTKYGPRAEGQNFGRVVVGHYYAPPEVVRLIENHLSPGLWGKSVTYDLYKGIGNLSTQLLLGWSTFHLWLTGLESVISKASVASEASSRGEMGLAGKFGVQVGPQGVIKGLIRGYHATHEFYSRDADANDTTGIIGQIIQGGGGLGWSLFEHENAPAKFMTDLRQILGAVSRGDVGTVSKKAVPLAFHGSMAVFELPTMAIMNHWVPYLKVDAFLDMAELELKRMGPTASLDEQRKVLGDAWDAVDDRFGQLRYENLFWNNTFKQLMTGGFLSVGWQVGSLRHGLGVLGQIPRLGQNVKALAAGGGKEPPGLPGLPMRREWFGREGEPPTYRRAVQPWLQRNAAWLFSGAVIVGTLGAIYQYLRTGKPPESVKDLYYPRNGQIDANGREERDAPISYAKDYYAWTHHPVTTLEHKLKPFLSMLWEAVTNEDFYGDEIRNTDDPIVTQIGDTIAAWAKRSNPIAWSNATHRAGEGATVGETLKAWAKIQAIPFTPANAEIERSDAENYLHSLYPPTHRTQEQAKLAAARRQLRADVEAKTPGAVRKARQEGLSAASVRATLRSERLGYLRSSFERTTWPQAVKAYDLASPEERRQLRQMLAQKFGRMIATAGTPDARKAMVAERNRLMQLPTSPTVH